MPSIAATTPPDSSSMPLKAPHSDLLATRRTCDLTPPILSMGELAPDIRILSKISEPQAIWAVVRQWLVIAATIGLFVSASPHLHWFSWAILYLISCLIIASRQHAFLALIHEATHYRLSDIRSWNNFLSDCLCAFPMGMSTEVYRRTHLQHHQHTNTSSDPDWVGMQMQEDWRWPKDNLTAAKLFIFDLIGLGAHKMLLLLFMWSPLQGVIQKHISLSWSERLRLVGFIAIVGIALTWSHAWMWFLLLWVVPMCTFLGAMVRIRAVAEHLVCPSENELNKTRHIEATWAERLFIAPLNVNYHLAHHLFPSVPWYNLPKLHVRLQRCAEFGQHAKLSGSYFNFRTGVLSEILKPAGGQAS